MKRNCIRSITNAHMIIRYYFVLSYTYLGDMHRIYPAKRDIRPVTAVQEDVLG